MESNSNDTGCRSKSENAVSPEVSSIQLSTFLGSMKRVTD